MSIPLKKLVALTTSENALYVTGTTILASCAATYASGQVRLLWARKLLTRTSKHTGNISKKDIANFRTLLGLGTFWEQFRFWSTTSALLLVGLLTTAIVTSVTPSFSLTTLESVSTLSPGNLLPCFYASDRVSNDWFSWKLANGSFLNFNSTYGLSGSDVTCTIRDVPGLFASLDYTNINDYDYAYAAGDTVVYGSAVGTPFVRMRNTGFFESLIPEDSLSVAHSGDTLTEYIELFNFATLCSPVLIQNPVKCRKFEATSVSKNGINATADGCSVSSPIDAVDPTISPANSFGVCTINETIGKATILISAVHDHAFRLAGVMLDERNVSNISGIPSYSAACKIDIAPSIDFRSVQFTHITPGSDLEGLGYSFELNSTNATCKPDTYDYEDDVREMLLSDMLTDGTLAHGAAASYYMLSQNVYRDGWWDNLYRLAFSRARYLNSSLDSYVFTNSENQLEDALGMVSASELSIYWADDPASYTTDEARPLTWFGGTAMFSGVRVGPGKKWAIVFIVPVMFTMLLLACLWWSYRSIP